MLCLAGRAVTELAVQWLLPTQLILDLAAVAAGLVTDGEVLIALVDTVWGTLLPLRDALGGLAAALVLVHFGAFDLCDDSTDLRAERGQGCS